jgi:hypothetical protein
VQILFPQISLIFSADFPNFSLKICENLRKKSAKSAGKKYLHFLSCTKNLGFKMGYL